MALGLIFSSLYWCKSIDLVILFLPWWKQRDSMYLKCGTHQWNQKLSLQYRIIWDLLAANGTVFIHQEYKSTFHTCSSGSQIQSTYKADFRYALAFASHNSKIDFFLFIKKRLKKYYDTIFNYLKSQKNGDFFHCCFTLPSFSREF